MFLVFLLVIMVLVPFNHYAFNGPFNCDGFEVPPNCHGLGHMVSIFHGYHDLVFLFIIVLLVFFLLCFFLSPYSWCSSWSLCSYFPSNHHGLGVLPSYCELVFLLIVSCVFYLLPWSCVLPSHCGLIFLLFAMVLCLLSNLLLWSCCAFEIHTPYTCVDQITSLPKSFGEIYHPPPLQLLEFKL